MMRNKRRISFARKAKQQRMHLYIILAIVGILFTCSLVPLADDGTHQVTVIADCGDTLWSLCEPYKPDDMDLRLFIDKVMYENGIKSSGLSIGQEIVINLD